MEWTVITKQVNGCQIEAWASYVGNDVLICLQGGERPHIGCTVQAVPRLSLKGDGSYSATSCVLNVTGHKDEQICRYAAEYTAKELQAVTVCTGGFHMDAMTPKQIEAVLQAAREIAESIPESLKERRN